ncbi:MAG: LacI family DNA-binding transcriptional regulator [Oscillospiraceae bacterium]|nr:LacI family DNA-binding transcriptional regulator [Oscillospiraceae bacterium]
MLTIKDIARLSGVSVSTVSRVLNDRPDVSEESRRRVRAVIEDQHYIPNNTARDLVRIRSEAIGLVVRGVQNPFYTDIIHAIERALDTAGYTMVMRQIGFSDDEIEAGAVMQREKRLRGIIFLGGRSDYTPDELARVTVPFVFCSYTNSYGTLDPKRYSSVSICDEGAAFDAVSKLVESGHTRVAALIADADDSSISQLRYQGYCRALREHGIPLRDELVFSTDDSFAIEDAYRAMGAALSRTGDFTALFAIADDMAIGAMRALREHGRSVPEDCSVIAIDGIAVSEYIHPMLTTLCQPKTELGAKSVELLLDVIEGRGGHEQVTLPTVFRAGASVRRLNAL